MMASHADDFPTCGNTLGGGPRVGEPLAVKSWLGLVESFLFA